MFTLPDTETDKKCVIQNSVEVFILHTNQHRFPLGFVLIYGFCVSVGFEQCECTITQTISLSVQDSKSGRGVLRRRTEVARGSRVVRAWVRGSPVHRRQVQVLQRRGDGSEGDGGEGAQRHPEQKLPPEMQWLGGGGIIRCSGMSLLSYNHTERQRPMLVYGDAWEWGRDRFSSVTAAADARCGYTLKEKQF